MMYIRHNQYNKKNIAQKFSLQSIQVKKLQYWKNANIIQPQEQVSLISLPARYSQGIGNISSLSCIGKTK